MVPTGASGHKLWHLCSTKITQDVRDYTAERGIAEETAALVQRLMEKAAELRKSEGDIYRRAGYKQESARRILPETGALFC